MELLVNPTSYSSALSLIKLGAHQICVGIKKWCVRNSCNLTLTQIKTLIKKKDKTKILILINRFYFDTELKELMTFIKNISKCKIDGIIFTDMAINQICYEEKINIPQIYNPETLVTNYGQFPFYINNNINEVALARELNKNEIIDIGKNKGNIKIQIQVAGYAYIMHSRWKLISNFKKVQKIASNLSNTKLLIRENSRKEPMVIYEDDYGSHMLSNHSLNLLDKLDTLNSANIDTLRIDSFLHDDKWVLETTKVYLEAINMIEKKIFDRKNISNLLNKLPKEKIFQGFYSMDKKDLIYLIDNKNIYE